MPYHFLHSLYKANHWKKEVNVNLNALVPQNVGYFNSCDYHLHFKTQKGTVITNILINSDQTENYLSITRVPYKSMKDIFNVHLYFRNKFHSQYLRSWVINFKSSIINNQYLIYMKERILISSISNVQNILRSSCCSQ